MRFVPTPCSPLLANITLHGMEEAIKEYAASLKGKKRDNQKSLSLIRYADDFVILHQDLNIVVKCKKLIEKWLSEYGLELSQEKTKIKHTLNYYEGQKPGFDFLGFNIRQYSVSKYQSGKGTHGKILGFKTIIKPSDEKVKEHYKKLVEIINIHTAAPQHSLIAKLNPVIRGWTNYYKTVCSSDIFSKIYHLLHKKLRRWADRRHPKKKKYWVSKKYWRTIGMNNWRFGCTRKEKEYVLFQHFETKITRHIKVKGNYSPYDGNTNYWASRMGKHPEMNASTARLFQKQKGKCNHCDLTFRPGDRIERDHIVPRKIGGHEYKNNLQLLHKHCHDEKTKEDLKAIRAYKSKQEADKLRKWFNCLNWKWVNDIPTLI